MEVAMRKSQSNWHPDRHEIVFWFFAIFVVLSFGVLIRTYYTPRAQPQISVTSTVLSQKIPKNTPSVIIIYTPAQSTFKTVCDLKGKVALQGFIHLPETSSCNWNGEPATCPLNLTDPLSGKIILVDVPMDETMEGLGYPNQMFIWSSIGEIIGDQDMVQITGYVDLYETADASLMGCKITDVSEVERISEFTFIDWDFPRSTLRKALSKDLIDVIVVGNGLTKINVKIIPKMDFQFELEIEAGTIFEAQTVDVQNMVVRKAEYIHLKPGIEAELDVDVSCADMEKEQPSNTDIFTVSTMLGSQDLLKLFGLEDFIAEPFRIQQFAVWTITDNPAPDEYMSLSSGPAPGRGPSPDEMKSIKDLFLRADINISQYQALPQ
jgi:hypothetical protein